jgi:hypothetical protein
MQLCNCLFPRKIDVINLPASRSKPCLASPCSYQYHYSLNGKLFYLLAALKFANLLTSWTAPWQFPWVPRLPPHLNLVAGSSMTGAQFVQSFPAKTHGPYHVHVLFHVAQEKKFGKQSVRITHSYHRTSLVALTTTLNRQICIADVIS